ncbi:hypothetical protein PCANB_000548 [Pneumocystis canis]|nr:hypothetical protein PCANB_000548 [Pneumocystis canis]
MSSDYSISIFNAISVDDIEKNLHELYAEQISSNVSLYYQRIHKEIYASSAHLYAQRSLLNRAYITFEQLQNSIYIGTSWIHSIRSNLYSKISQKTRINDSLQRLEDVRLLKISLYTLQTALEQREWEKAAQIVQELRNLSLNVLDGFAAIAVPTEILPNTPIEVLNTAIEALKTVFLRGFSSAVKINDSMSMTRFFKLFPMIGRSQDGLEVYISAITDRISEYCAKISSNDSTLTLPSINITNLLEYVATIINLHIPIVVQSYGKSEALGVIEKLHETCTQQCQLLLDNFWEEQQITEKIAYIQSYTFEFLIKLFSSFAFQGTMNMLETNYETGSNNTNETPGTVADQGTNIKRIDWLLTEISDILYKWLLYLQFVAYKYWEQKRENFSEIPQNILETSLNFGFLSSADITICTRLISFYKRMELFFMRHSVEKAFQLNEHDVTSKPPMSSFVDDVMCIFKKIVYRVLNTGRPELIQEVLTDVKRIIEMDYIGIIQRQITGYQGKLNQETYLKTLNHIKSSSKTKNEQNNYLLFIILLNNLDMSQCYIEKVVSDSISEKNSIIEKQFPFENYSILISQHIQSLLSLRNRLHDILNDGLNSLFLIYIKARLGKVLSDCFQKPMYVITSLHFDELERNELVQRQFAHGWDNIMIGFKNQLTEENMNRLIKISGNLIANNLEKIILNIKVNELGAIRLDKDISFILSHVVSYGSYLLHELFLKVREMIRVLNWDAEKNAEIVIDRLKLQYLSLVQVNDLLKQIV